MDWNFNVKKSVALEDILRLATKGTDPLKDDAKAVRDIASTAAGVASNDPNRERYMADLYNKSDMSQGLDQSSELYGQIQEEAQQSLMQVKEQLSPIITKYQDQADRDYLTGEYKLGYQEARFEKIKKSWEEIRPSQTVNPAPGQQVPAPAPVPPAAGSIPRGSL